MNTDTASLLEMRKFVAPEFIFGSGVIELAGQYAVNYNARKILLVTDAGVTAAGWTGAVERSLKKSGIPYVIFDGITANPKDYEVTEGVNIYRREQCDVIVAVGGGSPMDCAKSIGISSSNDLNVLSFEGVDQVPVPGPPLIFIPTTAGTAADISQFDIITDSSRKVKIAIVSKLVIPDVSLIDPDTTVTMDSYLTAATGMDALTHAIEAYVSNACSPVTDLFALEAIRLIQKYLLNAVNHPANMEARENMMLASLFAGLAFSNASLGMVHAMAHSLGGLLDLPHGECNAILLEHVIEFNFSAVVQRYIDVARALGLNTEFFKNGEEKEALLSTISDLRKKAGIRPRLRDMNLLKDKIPALAVNAFNDPCMATNPRTASVEDIRECYDRAF
jgi:alcohol dehydrogenase class IV